MMGELLWIGAVGFIFWVAYKAQARKKVKEHNRKNVSSNIKGELSGLSKTIGETRAVCPYCKNQLEKRPSQKIECPHCGNDIYKHTRPYDNEPILITEEQLEDVEEQWAIASGQYDHFLKEKARKERIRDRIREQQGVEPTEEDVEWNVLHEQSMDYFQEGNFGLYRNKRLEMARHLQSYLKPERALEMFMEVSYLDINGPNNNAGTMNRPPFSQKNENVLPGIIDHIKKLADDLDLNDQEVKSVYMTTAKNIRQSLLGLGLSVEPESAWRKISTALNK